MRKIRFKSLKHTFRDTLDNKLRVFLDRNPAKKATGSGLENASALELRMCKEKN